MTSTKPPPLDTHQKVLTINLDATKYGTFAEIGAGQEVVRWFFRVGGAAGTVAKSMSAYDMKVSDAIYGRSDRYVSRQRLIQMLEHEYQLNLERLKESQRQLFAFADTVAAKSYRSNNQCHGWMGIRYQTSPGSDPSQILLHVRMLDRENVAQQEALGIVGVNLIYGCFFEKDPTALIHSLLDGLTAERIEVDMIEFSGLAFREIDNRLMALELVASNLSDVAMFSSDGQVLQPSDVLYKSPILVERGSFRPVTLTHLDILSAARDEVSHQLGDERASHLKVLMEITMKNLRETAQLDPVDFLARADVLATVGQPVLITKYSEYYRLLGYLRQFTQEPIAVALGAAGLVELFDERYYQHLDGGMLEGLGRLFRPGVSVLAYPTRMTDGSLLDADTIEPAGDSAMLYDYLRRRDCIKTLRDHSREYSTATSSDVLNKMRRGDPSWESLVPRSVAELIRERGLFGYGSTPPANGK